MFKIIDNNLSSYSFDKIQKIEHKLKDCEKTNMRGYVFGLHETLDGKKELIDFNPNHIVLTGRKWLMQRAINASMDETPQQANYYINWFGIGSGGANSSDIMTPLYTPDQQESLNNPIKIYRSFQEGFKYSSDGYRKTFLKFDNKNAQMKYDNVNSEVVALFHLILDFNDCPYEMPSLGVLINELALYASPSENEDETNYIMFSRYCLPSKYKTNRDRYTFIKIQVSM